MKKMISVLCLCAMLLSLAGCGFGTPKVYGFCCGYSGKKETKFENPDSSVEKFAPKTATVEFMGQQYSGEYEETTYAASNYYPWRTYQSENCTFSVTKSGELCRIYLRDSFEKIPKEEHLTKEEHLQIARNVAMQYADVTGWVVTVDSHAVDKNGVPSQYDVNFVKHIDGIETSEKILVRLTPSGRVYGFVSYMLGEFTEENVRGKFDYKKLEVKVIDRMKKLTRDDAKRRNAELAYEVEFCLAKERKNKIVLTAKASCSCPATGEGHISAVWFIIR